jgi:hypothetical protein
MKKLILFLVLFIIINKLAAQYTDTWYFGDNASITFSSNGTGSGGTNLMETYEGCTTLNDPFGTVIFYANGDSIWDNFDLGNVQSMKLLGTNSATQASITVQIPKDETDTSSNFKFLVFSLKAIENADSNCFSVCFVKVTPEYFQGSWKFKSEFCQPEYIHNIPRMSEKLVSTSDNANGVWVIAHDFSLYNSSTTFYKYHITNALFKSVTNTSEAIEALKKSEILQNYGYDHSYFTEAADAQGQMKFTKSGDKLGLVLPKSGRIEIFDFDKQSGTLGNSRQKSVWQPNGTIFGCEFSPNGNYFYTSEMYAIGSPLERHINVWAITASNILGPNVVAADNYTPNSVPAYNGMQIGPNDKIYCTHRNGYSHVSVINCPNNYWSGWNYKEDSVWVSGTAHYSFPDLCRLKVQMLHANAGNDDSICKGDSVQIGGHPLIYGGIRPYEYAWFTRNAQGQLKVLSYLEYPYVKPDKSKYYYLGVRDGSQPQNQTALDSVLISVDLCPLTINAGLNDTNYIYCSYYHTLGGRPTAWGGTPPFTYLWSSIPPGFNSTLSNPEITPIQTTVYRLQVTDSSLPPIEKWDSVEIFIPTASSWPITFTPGMDKFQSISMNESRIVTVSTIGYSGTVEVNNLMDHPMSIFDFNPGIKRLIVQADSNGQLRWVKSLSTNRDYNEMPNLHTDYQLLGYPLDCEVIMDNDGNAYVLINAKDYVYLNTSSTPSIAQQNDYDFIYLLKFNHCGILVDSLVLNNLENDVIASDFKIYDDTIYVALYGAIGSNYNLIYILSKDFEFVTDYRHSDDDGWFLPKIAIGDNLILYSHRSELIQSNPNSLVQGIWDIKDYYANNPRSCPSSNNPSADFSPVKFIFDGDSTFYLLIGCDQGDNNINTDLWVIKLNNSSLSAQVYPNFGMSHGSLTAIPHHLFYASILPNGNDFEFAIQKHDFNITPSLEYEQAIPSLGIIETNYSQLRGYYGCSSWPNINDSSYLSVFHTDDITLGSKPLVINDINNLPNEPISLKTEISVYPIPTKTSIHMDLPLISKTENPKFEFYNCNGSLIRLQGTRTLNNNYEVNISALSEGLYLLKIISSNECYYKRIIVLK